MTTIDPATVPPRMTRLERLVLALEGEVDFLDNQSTRAMARQCIIDLLGMSDLPVGEGIYKRYCERIYRENADDQFQGTADELRNTLAFTRRWLPDVFPASDDGKVHFGRAIFESLIDCVEAHLNKEHRS